MSGPRRAGTSTLARLAVPALIAALAGCGQSSASRTPDIHKLPLVAGTRVIAQVTRCDHGANSYCALELVVSDTRFRSSHDLVHSEHSLLIKSGWSGATADTGEQHAAVSPGGKLRVTYATAYGDLKGIDLGWIKRPHEITLALSQTLFKRLSAMSVMLEVGSS